jgi:hypothetical protein
MQPWEIPDRLQALAEQIQENNDLIRDRIDAAYQCWLKHQTTLAAGGLTLLVSLRSDGTDPSHPAGWLLPACWGCLAASTVLGMGALAGEALRWAGYAGQFRKLAAVARKPDQPQGLKVAALEAGLREVSSRRPKTLIAIGIAAGSTFATAILCLAVYAMFR